MISILGVLKSMRPYLSSPNYQEVIIQGINVVLSLGLFIWIGLLFGKTVEIKDTENKRKRLRHLLCLAGPAAVLISPHSLFYDFGICWSACASYVRFDSDRKVWGFIALLAVIALATMAREILAFQPLFFLAAGLFIFILRAENRAE